ncbi:MAG: VOC family protein [Candidatus Rokubacteria bacterium]|nr:VOC family protein [Candidatus Rokubacteria bacterium]
MLTRIDHVMIGVLDLQQGIDTYTRIGFDIYPGGVNTARGTRNAIAFHTEDYLELAATTDPEKARFRYVAVQSDDLAADVAAMRRRSVDVADPTEGGRTTPAGQELRWTIAVLGKRHSLPVFFVQHLTPLDERRRQVPRAAQHPNGVFRVDRVYIAVADVAAAAKELSQVLGLPVPKAQRGGVIKADMCVFDLGPTGLTVAQPAEPGPAAEALERQGPGPFQALYRTSSMDAAARWMADHGVPPPIRGIRNTGEQAMLVPPEHACGAYIGLVGPA